MNLNLTQLYSRLTPYLFSHDPRLLGKFYCPPERVYDWQKGEETDHGANESEQKILTFLLKDLGHTEADSLLVLIGGTGTGKTTTVNKVLGQAMQAPFHCFHVKQGFRCEEKPLFLKLDFGDKSEDRNMPKTQAEEQFWADVAAKIEIDKSMEIDLTHEVTHFWEWCLRQSRLKANSLTVHKHLETWKHHIKAYNVNQNLMGLSQNDILNVLSDSRKDLIEKMQSVDLAWYKLHLLRYGLEKIRSDKCKCLFFLFDNVDHLHPHVQAIAVSFAINATELLLARTVVTIRPLTWERSVHAQRLTTYEYQYSPSLYNVISKRIAWFEEEQQTSLEEKAALDFLKRMLAGEDHKTILFKLLRSTAGHSIRFGCRNLSNMLESPLLSQIALDESDSNADLKVSTLARAFFFGTTERILKHAFDNLYALEGKMSDETWLIKSRILDYVIRFNSGHTHLQKVNQFLLAFGYDQELISSALNELLDGERPLLWCNVGVWLTSPISDGRLVATPIGHGYYRDLFGELFYDEVCLAKSQTQVVSPREIYAFDQDILDQDIDEIEKFINVNGTRLYKRFYPPRNYPSLSFLHYRNLLSGLEARLKWERDRSFYDPNRIEYIKKHVQDIINQPE